MEGPSKQSSINSPDESNTISAPEISETVAKETSDPVGKEAEEDGKNELAANDSDHDEETSDPVEEDAEKGGKNELAANDSDQDEEEDQVYDEEDYEEYVPIMKPELEKMPQGWNYRRGKEKRKGGHTKSKRREKDMGKRREKHDHFYF